MPSAGVAHRSDAPTKSCIPRFSQITSNHPLPPVSFPLPTALRVLLFPKSHCSVISPRLSILCLKYIRLRQQEWDWSCAEPSFCPPEAEDPQQTPDATQDLLSWPTSSSVHLRYLKYTVASALRSRQSGRNPPRHLHSLCSLLTGPSYKPYPRQSEERRASGGPGKMA